MCFVFSVKDGRRCGIRSSHAFPMILHSGVCLLPFLTGRSFCFTGNLSPSGVYFSTRVSRLNTSLHLSLLPDWGGIATRCSCRHVGLYGQTKSQSEPLLPWAACQASCQSKKKMSEYNWQMMAFKIHFPKSPSSVLKFQNTGSSKKKETHLSDIGWK